MAKDSRKKDTVTRTLQDLDLSENEATLYSLMIDRPRSTVQELSTYAPFPRTMLYYVLRLLMRRGLVSALKESWRTTYVAEDPERLYDLLADKEREFERGASSVRSLIPQLKSKYRLVGKRPNVRTFEGTEEYQKVLEDIVATNPKEICAYEVLTAQKSALEVRRLHEGRRIARKIKKKILFFENAKEIQALKKRKYDDYTQFRSVTKGVAPFEVDVMLYDGKILYTSYYDAHEPTAILVEDGALYDMQRNIFDSLWKEGKDRTLAYTETI